MKGTYSCIVPAFNEDQRVLDVLKTVAGVKEIGEVICVDDGSTDGTAGVVKVIVNAKQGESGPQVKLICHENNLGKSAAVASGLELARGESIVLIDSDLQNLKGLEISQAIKVFEREVLDCLLFNTAPMSGIERILRRTFRMLLLAAGNRIISRECLVESLRLNPRGYQLEMAQNKYLMENHYF